MSDPERNRGEHASRLLADALRESAPGIESVLDRLRMEKARRRANARFVGYAAGVATVLAILAVIVPRWLSERRDADDSTHRPELRHAVSDSPAAFSIERVNDQQLLELLPDQPAALVRFPDGQRQLLFVLKDSTIRQDGPTTK